MVEFFNNNLCKEIDGETIGTSPTKIFLKFHFRMWTHLLPTVCWHTFFRSATINKNFKWCHLLPHQLFSCYRKSTELQNATFTYWNILYAISYHINYLFATESEQNYKVPLLYVEIRELSKLPKLSITVSITYPFLKTSALISITFYLVIVRSVWFNCYSVDIFTHILIGQNFIKS